MQLAGPDASEVPLTSVFQEAGGDKARLREEPSILGSPLGAVPRSKWEVPFLKGADSGSGAEPAANGTDSGNSATQSADMASESWEEEDDSGHGSARSSGSGRLGHLDSTDDASAPVEGAELFSRGAAASSGGSSPDVAADAQEPEDGYMPSLWMLGGRRSAGSAGHPDDCKPCAFYCFSLRGCWSGDSCEYCHLFHESRLRQRRSDWRRTRRERRRGERAEKAQLAGGDARARAQKEVLEAAPAIDADLPAVAAVGTAPWHFHEKATPTLALILPPMPQRAAPVRRVPPVPIGPCTQQAVPAPHAPPMPSSLCMQQATAPPSCALELPSQPVPSPPAAKPSLPWPMQEGLAMWKIRQQAMRQAALGAGQLGPASGVEFFDYTPSTAVVKQGDMVEFWPPVALVDSGFVFAVSPQMPPGLEISNRTGVICGRPKAGGNELAHYFVAACKPGDPSSSVRVSVFTLKVLGPAGHAREFEIAGADGRHGAQRFCQAMPSSSLPR